MNLSAIDLNLLWVLHAVLTERSVARAAARLHVTSPAVSNALSRLRGALGDPLLVRSGRGLVPTPRALQLGPVLARSFADLEGGLTGGAFDPKTCTRELTIALSDAELIAALPKIAKLFAQRLPVARMKVVSLDTLISSGGLAGELVDLTIGPAHSEEGVHHQPLFREEGLFVARQGHPRVKKTLTRERFNSERHVDIHLLLGKPGAGHRAVEAAFSAMGLTRDIAVTVPTFTAAAAVVANTDFLCGMPRRTAQFLSRALPLRVLDGPGAPFPFPMSLHWHERTHADAAVTAFRAVVTSAFQAAGDGRASGR